MELVVKIWHVIKSIGFQWQTRVLLLRSVVHRLNCCLVVKLPREAPDLVECSLMVPTKLLTDSIVPDNLSLVHDVNEQGLSVLILIVE